MLGIKHLSLIMGSCHLLTEKCVMMYPNIIDNLIPNTPSDEIQLCYSRMNFIWCLRYLVHNFIRATKWVKQLFTLIINLISYVPIFVLSIMTLLQATEVSAIAGHPGSAVMPLESHKAW